MLNSSSCRDRPYVEEHLLQGQTVCWTAVPVRTGFMLISSYCRDKLQVCWTAVTVGTDCMLNISNCRDRLYVEQRLLQGQAVCWTAVAEGAYCMLNSSNCRDRLCWTAVTAGTDYVEQRLLQGQAVCWTALTAGTDCILNRGCWRGILYLSPCVPALRTLLRCMNRVGVYSKMQEEN